MTQNTSIIYLRTIFYVWYIPILTLTEIGWNWFFQPALFDINLNGKLFLLIIIIIFFFCVCGGCVLCCCFFLFFFFFFFFFLFQTNLSTIALWHFGKSEWLQTWKLVRQSSKDVSRRNSQWYLDQFIYYWVLNN